ncbi:MAG: RNA polymerase factor sigma-54 [Gammaproteobacteria bacterium]|nr:RNA polymerase factor sigma-54 [Gammaproteobacteria bacterium]
MKQTLQLRISQQLTMTPQLQQAIRLLQLSTLELETEVQDALESNPMLEQDDGEGVLPDEAVDNAEATGNDNAPGAEGSSEVIPDELPTDSNWDDVFDTGTSNISAPEQGNTRDIYETITVSSGGLHGHLTWQLELTNISETDKLIARTIIDAIDDSGYLTASLGEIHDNLDKTLEVDPEEVQAVLHRVQQFDPIGVSARDLQECLQLQLTQFEKSTPWLTEAKILIRDYFGLLSNRDFSKLGKKMKLSTDDLKQVIHLIQSLNPRPGAQFNDTEPEYIAPDVYVKKKNGKWTVDLNTDSIPKLRINSLYANMVKRGSNSKDNNYLRNNLQEARWFLKSLQSRHDTLIKVATCIVERQRGFLDYGEEAMKPLVLRSIAEAIDMHESTISRVTTRKYMHTPRGIFEFKFFFSSHVSTETGGECSATAIRAIIKKLVAAENPRKPLSDNKMASVLAEQGINVARRTIAKYREALSISPSNERKRLA